jgi:signal transduction histidine kinase
MLERFGTLRYQIALLLLLVIAPLAAFAIYLEVEDRRKDAQQAEAESRHTVNQVSQELNLVLKSTRDLVQGFSRNPLLLDHPDACNAQLASLNPALPLFANMVVVDLDLNVICAGSNPTHMRRLPRDPAMDAVFERVRQTRQTGVGVYEMSAQRKRMLPLIGPMIDRDGRLRYFFSVNLDLKWLDEQVNAIAIPKGAILLVMDRRGTIMARNPPSKEFTVGTPAPPYERTLPAHGDFDGEIKGEGGINRVYSLAQVGPGDGLTVVMKMRSSEIYQPARQRLALHLASLGSVGLLVLGLAWLGSKRYFTGPLSTLIRTADRLAAGDRSARSGLLYASEIGGLAQSLDLMADALEKEQIRTLRTDRAFRSIMEGTSTSAGEEFFRSLVSSLTSAFEADFAFVGELSRDLKSVNTLATSAFGQIVGNLSYELEGTPSQSVINLKSCYYHSGIQDLFPGDAMLRESGVQGYLGASLPDPEGKPIGLIAVLHRQPISDDVTDPLAMLKVFAARASVELTRLRVERELRESLARNLEMVRALQELTAALESVREEERTHIAREIHDELGQQLTAMRFGLKSLKGQLTQGAPDRDLSPALSRVSDLIGLVDSMIGDIRRIATELRPQVLDAFGMVAAIEWLAQDFRKRTGIACRYDGPKDLAVDRELATAVFRICQESLTNVARHAHATEARIHLCVIPATASGLIPAMASGFIPATASAADGAWLSLEVSDNGKGISQETLVQTRSLGVIGMRERARMAGGELTIVGDGGGDGEHGASIRVRFPFESSRAHAASA